MAKTSWNTEVEGWSARAEAEQARDEALRADPASEAVVLGLHDDGTWDEDLDDATAFSVCDGSGAFQLFPQHAVDESLDDLDDTDFAAPDGFVWVFVA